MLNIFFRRAALPACAPSWGLAVLLAWASMLWMPAAQAAEGEPSQQAAATPFKHYQGWRDGPPQDWRQANERVGEVGGWRTYLRESQQGGGDGTARGHHGQHGH